MLTTPLDAPELRVNDAVISSFAFEGCDLKQLDALHDQANLIINKIKAAKKAASILVNLERRVDEGRFVRCTTESVQTTAAARYLPANNGSDLSRLSIKTFIGLVTYLPLPELRQLFLSGNVTSRLDQMFQRGMIDPRWRVYYERLLGIDPDWSSRMFQGQQNHTTRSIHY